MGLSDGHPTRLSKFANGICPGTVSIVLLIIHRFLIVGHQEMETGMAGLKWFQFRERIIAWQAKHAEDQPVTVGPGEERSIIILQKRYGFTRAQAIYQLRKYYSQARLGG